MVIVGAGGAGFVAALEAMARGARVVDATCPRVRSSQRRAASFSERGYSVFLAGERGHGEVVGVAAYAADCIVVATSEEAREAAARLEAEAPDAKTVLIGQTTLTAEEYAAEQAREEVEAEAAAEAAAKAAAQAQDAES